MILFPAIDIYNGKCVRLTQGKFDQSTIYFDNPMDAAKKWVDCGAQWLHVVDLNGAVEGKPINIKLIESIMTSVELPIQIGGGIRNQEVAEIFLTMGAGRVVLGSAALSDPDLIQILCHKFSDRIAVGLDASDGKLAIHGWKDTVIQNPIETAQSFEGMGVNTLIYTDISKDGMMTGPNFEATQKMVEAVNIDVIASGGISSLDDIKKLKALGVHGAILGRALYENKINLQECIKIL